MRRVPDIMSVCMQDILYRRKSDLREQKIIFLPVRSMTDCQQRQREMNKENERAATSAAALSLFIRKKKRKQISGKKHIKKERYLL